jgi:hypothetical protein
MTASLCAARMEEALAEYLESTKSLHAALRGSNPEEAAAAVETRDRCIRRYAEATDRWCALPEGSRNPELLGPISWHHHCINLADTEIIGYIESLKNEVGDHLASIGKRNKMERGYLPPTSGKAEILDGEG